MYRSNGYPNFSGLFGRRPQAIARIKGGAEYPDIVGSVWFYPSPVGVLTVAEIYGLPLSHGKCGGRVFGFHIHDGDSCGEDESGTEFSLTGAHYDNKECEHPYHAGDMPPLFSNNGYAFLSFVNGKISIDEIVGKTVVIHDGSDDLSTQPAGNSGKKIACGEILG